MTGLLNTVDRILLGFGISLHDVNISEENNVIDEQKRHIVIYILRNY